MNQITDEYFDNKWKAIIPKMPQGGEYLFNLRQHGYDIVKDAISKNSKVFDYACGLGVIDKQLVKEKQCKVSGCDFSKVAIDYCNSNIEGNFKLTDEIFGDNYDYILAIYFLEHIKNPVEWLKECFKKTGKVICVLPNNFRRNGEHIYMQWGNWVEFNNLFKEFKVTRLDNESNYPSQLSRAFKHPIFLFEGKNGKRKNKTGGKKGKVTNTENNKRTNAKRNVGNENVTDR